MDLSLSLKIASSLSSVDRIFLSGKGVWDANRSNLTIRRGFDSAEKTVSRVNGVMDETGIRNFLEFNRLDGGSYRNYLADIPLGVGTTISTGWSSFNNGTGTKDVYIDSGKQVIEVLTNTSSYAPYIRTTEVINVTSGETLSFECTVKSYAAGRSAKIDLAYYIDESFYSSLNGVVSSTIVGSDEILTSENITIPAGVNQVRLLLRNDVVLAGSVGIVEFSDVKLVKNDFITNIGELTTDSNDDGVADEWISTYNGFDGTIVDSVSETGQKKEITVAGTNISQPYVQYSYDIDKILVGKTYEITYEARISGDVSAVLIINNVGGDPSSGSGSVITNTEWESSTFSTTIITVGTAFQLKARLVPNQIGSIGWVEFRNIRLKQTNDTATVVTVSDYTGNGNHATQPNATEQPALFVDGEPVLNDDGNYGMLFDGVDDYMTSDFGETFSQPNTIFSYAEKTKDATQFLYDGIDASFRNALFQNGTNLELYSGLSIVTPISNYTDKLIGVFNAPNSKLYNQESEIIASGDTFTVGLAGITIGSNSTTTLFFGGIITSIAVFDKVLTQDEIKRLNTEGVV